MQEAINANNWFQVGEILKAALEKGERNVDLSPFFVNAYRVDPEIFASYFLTADLKQPDRERMHSQFYQSMKRFPVAADIMEASRLYHGVLNGAVREAHEIETLKQKSTSTVARFYASLSLLHRALAAKDLEETTKHFAAVAGLVGQRMFFSPALQRYVNAGFAAILLSSEADVFKLQFVAKLLDEPSLALYNAIVDGKMKLPHGDFQTSNPTLENERITVPFDCIMYHAHLYALQVFLLAVPLHLRSTISYDQVREVLRVETDIEMEQVFTALVLQGLINARLDSVNREVKISFVKPVTGNQKIKEVLVERLDEWIHRIRDCKSMFEDIMGLGEAAL